MLVAVRGKDQPWPTRKGSQQQLADRYLPPASSIGETEHLANLVYRKK